MSKESNENGGGDGQKEIESNETEDPPLFSKEAKDFIRALLQKDASQRLVCVQHLSQLTRSRSTPCLRLSCTHFSRFYFISVHRPLKISEPIHGL